MPSFTTEEIKYIESMPAGGIGTLTAPPFNKMDSKWLLSRVEVIGKSNANLAARLLEEAETRARNCLDLHFIYNQWIQFAYRLRNDAEYLSKCEKYCLLDIELYPQYRAENIRQYGSFNIRLPSFERLTIIYEKSGRIKEAVELCEFAIRENLIASTKGGFEGRLDKLLKKKQA